MQYEAIVAMLFRNEGDAVAAVDLVRKRKIRGLVAITTRVQPAVKREGG